MKCFTGQKKKSPLQGHRRRRRKIRVSAPEKKDALSWIEYKTLRQYQSMGDILDELRIYGFQAGVENIIERNRVFESENGHNWLTSEPGQKDV
ncbi:MAG: hypothetical protein BMS9Abin23_0539 [Thermodesulfobacteriota bacterium]|nr:MAG: hypothetical protein BMS9Abin23_0539 [Thermodesulfobacteriota bacterium]